MSIRTGDGGWNPYLAGVLTGLLAVAAAFVTAKATGKATYLGASTTFVRAAGFIERGVAPVHVRQNRYFMKEGVKIDWQFMFVGGILLGALASSLFDRSFKPESVPPLWKSRFGASLAKRAVWAFAGGVIAMFGARLADGCPTGHGLSGMMQLSLSGFAAIVFFFVSGMAVSRIIYRGGRQ